MFLFFQLNLGYIFHNNVYFFSSRLRYKELLSIQLLIIYLYLLQIKTVQNIRVTKNNNHIIRKK